MSRSSVKHYRDFRRLVWAIIACCAGAAAGARAAVVFNNFGPGNTFNTSTGYTETGVAPGQSLGEGFSPSLSGSLDQITIALTHISGANDVHLYLADGSTGTPGNILESWVVSNLPGGGSHPPLVINSVAQPLLTAGNLYYLYSLEPGTEMDVWNYNPTSEQGPFIVSQNGSPYYTGTHLQGAFSVDVIPVPEPTSAALLLGLGLAGWMLRAAKRR